MNVDITDEEMMIDDSVSADDAVLEEAWPIPPEDYTREFEQYLEDIGLRF